MATLRLVFVVPLFVIIFALTTTTSRAALSVGFYAHSCPAALPAIKRVVEFAVHKERRMGASLLRLHFHDCFVNGCDGSVLLDPTSKIDSEKLAAPNVNSVRGFEVVDAIKAEVDKVCGGPVVSCADILAIAARDSVVALGGPHWDIPLGRRDSKTASRTDANNNLPPPFLDLPDLIANFRRHGLDEKDLVVLSGGHTIGFSQCLAFRPRLYSERNIDPAFAARLKMICPRTGGDRNLGPLDSTPVVFDKQYFVDLVHNKGLLHSDQVLFNGGSTSGLVKHYSTHYADFAKDFGVSMIKMGNIKPLTGYMGEIRKNCRVVNHP